MEALLGDEEFASKLRELFEKHQKPHTYLPIDDQAAKVLYAILKLQHHFLQETSVSALPQADRKRIVNVTSLTADQVNRTIVQLRAAGYILRGNLRHVHGTGEESSGGHEIFEVDVPVVASCADTAVVLLELLEQARQNVKVPPKRDDSRPLDNEMDGKVDRTKFVAKMLESRKLAYFSREDLLGDAIQKGKLDQVTDAGEYIERVSSTHIRPRMRIALERPYLALLAQQVPLEDLQKYKWDAKGKHWKDGSLTHSITE